MTTFDTMTGTGQGEGVIGYRFLCPLCDIVHEVYTEIDFSVDWQFNGDANAPTLAAPVDYRYLSEAGQPMRCVSTIKDGQVTAAQESTVAKEGEQAALPGIEDGPISGEALEDGELEPEQMAADRI